MCELPLRIDAIFLGLADGNGWNVEITGLHRTKEILEKAIKLEYKATYQKHATLDSSSLFKMFAAMEFAKHVFDTCSVMTGHTGLCV